MADEASLGVSQAREAWFFSSLQLASHRQYILPGMLVRRGDGVRYWAHLAPPALGTHSPLPWLQRGWAVQKMQIATFPHPGFGARHDPLSPKTVAVG